ncbi:hypothetical protein Tsubulata_020897, partial [Turnera subulata]
MLGNPASSGVQQGPVFSSTAWVEAIPGSQRAEREGKGRKGTQTMASSTAVRELQRDLENKANDLSKLQKGILYHSRIYKLNHQVRKKYTIQLGENELVLKELDLLREDANVFKLIGPVLVKQDLAEANANVRKRIEYISAELYLMKKSFVSVIVSIVRYCLPNSLLLI